MLAPSGNPTSRAIRRKALMKALVSLVVIYSFWPLGLLALLERLSPGSLAGYPLLLVMAIPVVVFFIGVVETFTGTRFRHFSSTWNSMSERRQGLFSFILLALATLVVALLICLFSRYLGFSESNA